MALVTAILTDMITTMSNKKTKCSSSHHYYNMCVIVGLLHAHIRYLYIYIYQTFNFYISIYIHGGTKLQVSSEGIMLIKNCANMSG